MVYKSLSCLGHYQVVIETDCGVKLAFCDPRRFGKIRLQADPENNEPISKLGFDPILSMPDLDTFSAMLTKQKRAVKPLLLDQSFSAGVGNWVADEILYQARIHPEQKAASLDEAQCSALHHQMQVSTNPPDQVVPSKIYTDLKNMFA